MSDFKSQTDSQLVSLVTGGEKEAYKELVSRYQGHVYGLAYSLVGNWAEAQDIAQETFIRCYTNLDQLRDHGKFAAWLRRVAFGVTMDWLKTFRPKVFASLQGQVDLDNLDVPDFQPGPAEVVEKKELAEAVLAAVASLPPKYRVPLTMFHLDGLSYQKVADFLDIPLGTAKSLVSRAQAKLKAALAAAVPAEDLGTVQEVFNEHKLPAEFASKVLENVPALGWGKGKDCTFAGSLEAALAVTEHPYSYADIMGFTALAFRVRWFKGNDWTAVCPSCAVGEMNEEIKAASKATGWKIRIMNFDSNDRVGMMKHAPQIIDSIDSGKPVAAYTDQLDLSVIYGYADGGKTLMFRDYNRGDNTLLPVDKIGWQWHLLGDYKPAMSRDQAVITGLKMAVNNWKRQTGPEGWMAYWYGPEAYKAWRQLLVRYDEVPEGLRPRLFHCNAWNLRTMVDARRAAVRFLESNADLLPQSARDAAMRAAGVYRQMGEFFRTEPFAKRQCFVFPSKTRPLANWTPDIRNREIDLLTEAERYDAAAMTELEKLVAAL